MKTTHSPVLENAKERKGDGERKDVSQGEEANQRKDVNQKKKVKKKEKLWEDMATMMAVKSKMTKRCIEL